MTTAPTFSQPIMTTPPPRPHRARRLGLAALILAAAVAAWVLVSGNGKTPGAAPLRMADQGGVNLPNSAPQWKYVELAGPLDAQAIERELMGAMSGYAESLLKGLSK